MENSVDNSGAVNTRGLTGSTLKIIAMVTMLIDHIAASVLYKYWRSEYIDIDRTRQIIYEVLRGIGRLAFPIFIFLLIEGFVHTSNRWKYLGRLSLFALVSEIPFDLALKLRYRSLMDGKMIYWSAQNVFFTLAIGFLAITLIDIMLKKDQDIVKTWIFVGAITAAAMGVAKLLSTDYGAIGVLAIIAAYFFREMPALSMAIVCGLLCILDELQAVAIVDVLFVQMYNGQRGLKVKWLFYAFYPVHLLILFGICFALHI